MAHGLALSRLPPHLQNLIKDPRPHMMLFHEGKTDPVLSVMEQVRYDHHSKRLDGDHSQSFWVVRRC